MSCSCLLYYPIKSNFCLKTPPSASPLLLLFLFLPFTPILHVDPSHWSILSVSHTPIHSHPFPPKPFSTLCLRGIPPHAYVIIVFFHLFIIKLFPTPIFPFNISLIYIYILYMINYNFGLHCLKCWIFRSLSWFILFI